MTYGAMRAIMKKLLPKCGMTEEDAGCHSFRRGTATGLAHINAPSYVVKGIGIWGSDAYLGYIDATESGAMAQAMLAMAEGDHQQYLVRVVFLVGDGCARTRAGRGELELAHGFWV